MKSNQYFKLMQLNVEKPTVFKVVWNVTLLLNFFIVALITLSALLQIPHTIVFLFLFLSSKRRPGADLAFLISGGPNAEIFLSGLRKR